MVQLKNWFHKGPNPDTLSQMNANDYTVPLTFPEAPRADYYF